MISESNGCAVNKRPAAGTLKYLCFQVTREGQASHAHVHEIIEGLRSLGWSVELFEPRFGNREAPPALWRRMGEFAAVQIRLWRAFHDADALYVRANMPALPSVIWAKIHHIPTVLELNGSHDDALLAYPHLRPIAFCLRWMNRTCMSLADAVITVTPQLRDWVHSEIGEKPVYVIPNGANIDLFRSDAPCKLTLPAKFVVFSGVLARWQGIETLVEALEHPAWPPAVRLVVAGDGTERQRITDAAQRTSRIVYLGRQPYTTIPGIIARSLAGISPQNTGLGRSLKGGLSPLKVFETLACGVPVIVTDFPGQADLVRNSRCGTVIPAEDPGALARAVAYIYEHPELSREMGGRGRAAVEREHSWQHNARATGCVIRMAIRKRSSHAG